MGLGELTRRRTTALMVALIVAVVGVGALVHADRARADMCMVDCFDEDGGWQGGGGLDRGGEVGGDGYAGYDPNATAPSGDGWDDPRVAPDDTDTAAGAAQGDPCLAGGVLGDRRAELERQWLTLSAAAERAEREADEAYAESRDYVLFRNNSLLQRAIRLRRLAKVLRERAADVADQLAALNSC